MAQPGIKELLEAGVHFGHQTRRWNPKMRRFLFGERDGIYIIDLLKTKRLLDQASEFAGTIAHRGGAVLFVGTKKQARDAVREVAEATGMPYVNHRWLGGLLTNFQTMSERIRRLHDLERYETEGQLALLPTRERLSAQADLAKLRANLGGVKNMKGTPAAIFVIDLKTEAIAVREAQRLRIPIIGLVDTNCDPDGIDFVIPGNDDAIRSCAVIARAIGERVGEGAGVYRAEQERLRAEAEERARREAEERARREAEQAEQAALAAAAAAEAEAAAAAAARGSGRQRAGCRRSRGARGAAGRPSAGRRARRRPRGRRRRLQTPRPSRRPRRPRGRRRRSRPSRRRRPKRRPQPSRPPNRRPRRRQRPPLPPRSRPPSPRQSPPLPPRSRQQSRPPSRPTRRPQKPKRSLLLPTRPPSRSRRLPTRPPRRSHRPPPRRRSRSQSPRPPRERKVPEISAQDVKALRERTGAGMMDCKRALTEAGGDVEKAIELLRVKQGKRIEDRGERVAAEGTIQTYVHHNAKIGAIVEVDCETDFVARNDDFVAFAREVASHIAAAGAALGQPGRGSRRGARRRAADVRAGGRRQAGGDPREDRRGQARQVVQRGRAARPAARQLRQARGQDDRRACRTRSPPRPARTS